MRPTVFPLNGILYWTIRTTTPSTGVLVDADSTPTVSVRKNGSSYTAESVTITKRSATTGIYDCSFDPAAEAEFDQFTFEESAVISSVTYSQSFAATVVSPMLAAAGVRSAVGLTAADLDDQLGEIATDADAVETRLSATRAGYLDNLSAGAVPTLAQILAGGDIDGFTLEQTLKLCLSALAGKLSGAAETTITIRSADDTADRIVATVDSSGNRSVVTLNAAG